MDEMVFQYNNQNSIYVLNSNYGTSSALASSLSLTPATATGSTYADLARLKLIDTQDSQFGSFARDERDRHYVHTITPSLTVSEVDTGSSSRACSSVSRSLQHRLNSFGNPVGASSTSSSASSLTSSPAPTCLPTAATFHKFFNCSSNYNNSNSNGRSRERDCLSLTEKDNEVLIAGAMLLGCSTPSPAATSTSTRGNNNNPYKNCSSNSSNNNNSSSRKKCNSIGGGGSGGGSTVKSNLIAKKRKFWKFLEEEQLRTNAGSTGHLAGTSRQAASNCERQYFSSDMNSCPECALSVGDGDGDGAAGCDAGDCCDNSCVNTTATDFPTTTRTIQQPQQQPVNYYLPANEQQSQQHYKSNNWSRRHDSNNQKQQQPPQQQQQQKPQLQQQQQQQKSSSEMYKEAAELLGLSCTLCDNCRCLDCQSGYFDCDDSDSYSEFSLMDEYDVEDVDVDIVVGAAAAAAAQVATTAALTAGTTELMILHEADSYPHNMTTLCCNADEEEHDAEDEAAAVAADQTKRNVGEDETLSIAENCIQQHSYGRHDSGDGYQRTHVDEVLLICPENGAAPTTRIGIAPSSTGAVEGSVEGTVAGAGVDDAAAALTGMLVAMAPLRQALPAGKLQLQQQQQKFRQQPQQQQHSNELENCSNFNELSLVDAASGKMKSN